MGVILLKQACISRLLLQVTGTVTLALICKLTSIGLKCQPFFIVTPKQLVTQTERYPVFSHKLDEPKKFFNVERLPFSKDISQLITFLGTTSVENDVIAALTDKHTIPFV